MKLRNKKTGEIWETAIVNSYACGNGYRLLVTKDAYTQVGKHYDSLTELNEEWEDYEPKEPLIKDEKIRKAIRAWAEASEVNLQGIKVCIDTRNTEFIGWRKDETKGIGVEFRNPAGIENIGNGEYYTITELCGEED